MSNEYLRRLIPKEIFQSATTMAKAKWLYHQNGITRYVGYGLTGESYSDSMTHTVGYLAAGAKVNFANRSISLDISSPTLVLAHFTCSDSSDIEKVRTTLWSNSGYLINGTGVGSAPITVTKIMTSENSFWLVPQMWIDNKVENIAVDTNRYYIMIDGTPAGQIDVDLFSIPVSNVVYSNKESCVAWFRKLPKISTSKTITLGSKYLAKLTDEDKKIATDKGWTLA